MDGRHPVGAAHPLLSGVRIRRTGDAVKVRLLSALRTLLVVGVFVPVSFATLTALAGSTPASAATNGRYSIQPVTIQGSAPRVWFNYLVNPGASISDAVTVTNQTTQAIAFKLFSADAINAQGGGFALNPPQDPVHYIGAWVKLSTFEFTLPAHTLANVPFALDIPAGATPGDYAGGIVLSPVNPAVEKRGSVSFAVYQNVGARIYVRVHGPLHPGLSITQLSIKTSGWAGIIGGPVSSTVTYTLTNTGNEILNPVAKLSVSPLIGSTVTIPPRTYPSLLPENSVTVSYQLNSKEAFLRMSANLTVTSVAGTTSASAAAWVIPWVLIVVILGLIGYFWYRRRRRRVPVAPAAPAEAEKVHASSGV